MSSVVLDSRRVCATIDPMHGARLTSLRLDGHEVLGGADDLDAVGESIGLGSFAMVPWAGRVRGHDLHGTGRDARWEHLGGGRFCVELDDDWPERGIATLDHTVSEDALTLSVEWSSAGSHGCSLGFHPWFRRRVAGVDLVPDVRPTEMLERGTDHLPTGRLVEPSSQPWDDCFRLAAPPRLSWPGVLDVVLESDAPWWVVYTEPRGAICVEPQTAPPDVWNHRHLQADLPTRLTLTIRIA